MGSRNCSQYGKKISYKLAKKLSEKGICIVSGLARGIDYYAHKGAMEGLGKTIAVLGMGINKIDPEENKELANYIVENGGLVISEYVDDENGKSINFPKRNRIISGLSEGVVVVEAHYRSGSTITANYAIKHGRNLFCVPGNIDSYLSLGTNKLIQEGKAKLLWCVNDILEEIDLGDQNVKSIEENQLMANFERNQEKEDSGQTEDKQNLIGKLDKNKEYKDKDWKGKELIEESLKYQEVKVPLEYLKVYREIQNFPIDFEEILRKTKLKVPEINEKLAMLQIMGAIEELPGNRFKRI